MRSAENLSREAGRAAVMKISAGDDGECSPKALAGSQRPADATPDWHNRPRWARICLLAASLQCLVWGPFIIFAPVAAAFAYGFSRPPEDGFLWQGMGLVILLYGLGYSVAAVDPYRHYAVVLVGLLAKILGPVGMTWAVAQGQVSARVLLLIPIHDIIWWWPFAVIVLRGRRWPGRQQAVERGLA